MIKKIFHFLGGLYFALFLIAFSALLVMIGTFLEAHSESHLYAAEWIYGHPLFAGLLGLFFVNILFSALRRWPFKWRHIPFLTTHLGLLMIIAGTVLKREYGVQGHLVLLEGSASQKITLPHTYALHVEHKEPSGIKTGSIPISLSRRQITSFGDLQLTVLGYTPHVNEKWQTWIKGNHAYLLGYPRLPVHQWKEQDPLPPPSTLWLRAEEPWQVLAIRTPDLSQLLEAVYMQGIEKPLPGVVLHLNYSPTEGFQDPRLELKSKGGTIAVPLQGPQALLPQFKSPSLFRNPHSGIDLKRAQPILLLVEDDQGDCFAFAFDKHGRVYAESFSSSALKTLFAYDQGFGGYTVQLSIPFPPFPAGRQEKEEADALYLAHQLKEAMQHSSSLAPPLKLLKEACERHRKDFVETLITFLRTWQASHRFLMPNEADVLQDLQWHDPEHLKACQWISLLFNQLEQAQEQGQDLLEVLKRNNWPFLAQLTTNTTPELLTQIAQQMFSCASQLPNPPFSSGPARLLSAYLKAYDIEYAQLIPPINSTEEQFARLEAYHDATYAPLVLESPLTVKHEIETPQQKLEDNHPRVLIEVKKGNQKGILSLAYDPSGNQLKWPILNGEYTLRLQPQTIEIPYRVRLRQARQINHINSQQPYSYESDIAISEAGKKPVEKTLSMNRVHETWDGYRFYLAGMQTTPSGIKRVQLIINQDPFKYYLTYPGGMIVALGIGLLFWMRPYSKTKKKSE